VPHLAAELRAAMPLGAERDGLPHLPIEVSAGGISRCRTKGAGR